MKKLLAFVLLVFLFACKKQTEPTLTAQKIVDASIQGSGGERFKNHEVSFLFRDRKYVSKYDQKGKTLERYTYLDSTVIRDKRTNTGLERFINDSLISLPDSLVRRYSNSVNSVHYFVKLPFGLNDKAVNKTLLGEVKIKDKDYYKVKVTFDQGMGGEDFEDVYLYWFNKQSLKPDYLAYEFHVNGGGQRFREAFNERYVDSIRFVDYNNYKPKVKGTDIMDIDSLFEADGLELLSKIELFELTVNPN